MYLQKSNNIRLWMFLILLVLLAQWLTTSVYAVETKQLLNCHELDHGLAALSDSASDAGKSVTESIKTNRLCCDGGSCSMMKCHASSAIINTDPASFPRAYPSSSPYDSTGVASRVKRNNSLFRPPILG